MRRLRAIAAALLISYSAQAAELPDLGEAARATFSDAQEAKLGREIMRQIRNSPDYLDDPEIAEYLNGLGDRLAAASDDPSRRFEFFPVRDTTINAFALPGGYIGVHTGLISATRNESELAGVLAHEIAHVTQNHIARMVNAQQGSALTTLAALAVAILAARSSNGQLAEAAIASAGAFNVQRQLDYTRDHEREADRVGFQNLERSGIATAGLASFFERLQSQGRLYENNAPAYLRTHPLTYERIADMQNRLQSTAYRQSEDSLEYHLVRAKVRAQEADADTVVKRLSGQDVVGEVDEAARRYGLAWAQLRRNDPARAAAELKHIPARLQQAPMLVTLAAEVAFARGRGDEALAGLRAGLRSHPDSKALAEAYVRGLLRQKRPDEALAYLKEQSLSYPDDPRLHELMAQAHQGLNQAMEAHMAMAEAHVRRQHYDAAVEQLQLALRSGEKDFYKLSMAEARLRQMRELERLHAKH